MNGKEKIVENDKKVTHQWDIELCERLDDLNYVWRESELLFRLEHTKSQNIVVYVIAGCFHVCVCRWLSRVGGWVGARNQGLGSPVSLVPGRRPPLWTMSATYVHHYGAFTYKHINVWEWKHRIVKDEHEQVSRKPRAHCYHELLINSF